MSDIPNDSIVSTTKMYAVRWPDGGLSPDVFQSVAAAEQWCSGIVSVMESTYGLTLDPEALAHTIIETTRTVRQSDWAPVPETPEPEEA